MFTGSGGMPLFTTEDSYCYPVVVGEFTELFPSREVPRPTLSFSIEEFKKI
jgi:hypothetical protein